MHFVILGLYNKVRDFIPVGENLAFCVWNEIVSKETTSYECPFLLLMELVSYFLITV